MNCSVENCSFALVDTTDLQPLTVLRPGQWAEIQRIDSDAPMIERLGDLGLQAGKRLQCVRISFLGDPIAYWIEGTGTILAIRKQDASYIHVHIVENPKGGVSWA